MKTIERERIEVVFLPPTLIYMMMSHPQVRDFDYSSLRALVTLARRWRLPRSREAIEVFGQVMMNMFGQAEANGPIAFLLPEEHRPNDGRNLEAAAAGDRETIIAAADGNRWMTTAAFFLQACPVKLSFAVG